MLSLVGSPALGAGSLGVAVSEVASSSDMVESGTLPSVVAFASVFGGATRVGTSRSCNGDGTIAVGGIEDGGFADSIV